MEYNEEQKLEFWNNTNIVDGENENEVRRDASGAIIHYSEYKNRDSIYGWEIDHIYPRALLEAAGVPEALINNLANLRAMNWQNNVSKGSDYPRYSTVVKAEGSVNVETSGSRIVNAAKQEELQELYKDYLR